MSSIGLIDFSSEHRDKVRMVLDFLKVGGVVDELGIGIVRDAFADRLFIGFSTIQTRAGYKSLFQRSRQQHRVSFAPSDPGERTDRREIA